VWRCKRCKRQYEAVRTVECAQCAWQCVAVFLEVYVSAHGSVRWCAAVRQCLAGARLCAAVRTAVCGSVWQCVAVHMAVCGSALYVYELFCFIIKSLRIYIGMPL
jgi:hypothetical protein